MRELRRVSLGWLKANDVVTVRMIVCLERMVVDVRLGLVMMQHYVEAPTCREHRDVMRPLGDRNQPEKRRRLDETEPKHEEHHASLEHTHRDS